MDGVLIWRTVTDENSEGGAVTWSGGLACHT